MFLYGCSEDVIENNIIKEIERISLGTNSSKENITENLYFPSTLPSDENINLTYKSLNPNVINDFGVVTQQEDDTLVTVLVTTQGTYNFEFELSYLVLAKNIQVIIKIYIEKFQLYEKEIIFETRIFDGTYLDTIYLPEGYMIDYLIDSKTNETISLDSPIKESKTLIAILKFKTYEITFLNVNDEILFYEQYDYMDKYNETYQPIKEGYLFYGWYYMNEFGHEVDLIDNYTFITSNIKAYPLWIKN